MRYAPERFTLATNVCYSNGATQLYTYEVRKGTKINKITGKYYSPITSISRYLLKIEIKLDTLTQIIRIYSQGTEVVLAEKNIL